MRNLLTLALVSAVVSLLCLTAATAQPFSARGWQDKLDSIEQRGLGLLRARAAARGINNSADEFKTKRVFIDEENLSHVHVQQTFQDVPVFGAEAIVHMTSDGDLFAMSDDLSSEPRLVNTIPSLDDKA